MVGHGSETDVGGQALVIAPFDPHAPYEGPSRGSGGLRGRKKGSDERSEERTAARRGGGLGTNRRFASGSSGTATSDAEHSQRVRRFRLQQAAGRLLATGDDESIGSVAACGRRRRSDVPEQAVQIRRTAEGSTYAAGLQRCSNVHACPICAKRIANQRRLDAITALSSWRAQGGYTYMLTLTVPHRQGQPLHTVLKVVSEATRSLNSGRDTMKGLLLEYGYIGQIRTVEVTHGENGWHPHLHILVLTRKAVPDEIPEILKRRWVAAVESQGWTAPSWDHGATWQGGDKAAEYVNKAGNWGMAEEITMHHVSKAGSAGSRTPFEILQDAALGDEKSALLFVEYGRAMKGRKQQFWSRGLKALFGIVDLKDDEIDEEKPQDEVLGEVQPDEWRLVVRYEERAELFRAAELLGQIGIAEVVRWLHGRAVADKARYGVQIAA